MSENLTAEQLIEQLRRLPGDTPIFIRGYEGGVNYATALEAITVDLFANAKEWYGQHEPNHDGDCKGYELVGYRISKKAAK